MYRDASGARLTGAPAFGRPAGAANRAVRARDSSAVSQAARRRPWPYIAAMPSPILSMRCAALLMLPALCSAAEPAPLRVVITATTAGDFAAGQRAFDVVMRRAGLSYSLTREPFERAAVSLKAGLYDIDAARIDGFDKDVPGMQRVDPPLGAVTVRVYGRRPLPAPPTLAALAGYRVAHVHGQRMIENLLSDSSSGYAVATPEACQGMVAAGRVEYCVFGSLSPPEPDPAREPLQFQVISQTPVYIWVGPGREALARRLAQALRSASASGDIDRALQGQRTR